MSQIFHHLRPEKCKNWPKLSLPVLLGLAYRNYNHYSTTHAFKKFTSFSSFPRVFQATKRRATNNKKEKKENRRRDRDNRELDDIRRYRQGEDRGEPGEVWGGHVDGVVAVGFRRVDVEVG